MDETTQADPNAAPAAAPEAPASEPSQDPVAAELTRVETGKRTRLEKLEFTKKRVEEQIAQERKAAGLPETDPDRPVTFADLERIEAERSVTTSLQMAESIENENERKLVIHHLENTIRPSGNPAEDFKTARAIVSAVKTGQILEEVARTQAPRQTGSAPSAPPKQKDESELTPEEQIFMTNFKMTKEQVLAARKS